MLEADCSRLIAFVMAESIHFIGIGGVGMSALAQIMHRRGARVSGSDRSEGAMTKRLASEGITIHIGHDAGNINGAVLVVYSAAIPDTNPELETARRLGITTISRAQMLGRMMEPYKNRVAITGTHGKTTTTSMTSLVLSEAKLDPTVLIGGDLQALGGNVRIGESPLFVTEACEAFDSFLHLHPNIAVITNIDADHLDYYGTMERIFESFGQFISQVDQDGCIIACMDDANVRTALENATQRVVSYSVGGDADISAVDVELDSPQASYMLVRNGKRLGRVTLGVPGAQNVADSLAAAAVGFELGASFEDVRKALAQFNGTGRRFEILGTVNDVMVIDDYAHHPTEIHATIEASRLGWNRRIIAVFQPHLYSRTQIFAKEFAESLSKADVVVLTDIYAAREKPIEGVTAALIADKIDGAELHYIPSKSDICEFLRSEVRPGDMVITIGAGDIRTVGEELVAALGEH